MKSTILSLFILLSSNLLAQRGIAKMAPEYDKGYYVNFRSDTVWGEIRTNVEDPVSLYHEFTFKMPHVKRGRVFKTNRVRAYGFGGKSFVMVSYRNEKMFAERLSSGRLALYEYKFHGKVDGLPAIESAFFVRDTWAEPGADQGLSRINNKFYKKSLKPFMKEEQPLLWERMDKYDFSRENLLEAIRGFNSNYRKMAN